MKEVSNYKLANSLIILVVVSISTTLFAVTSLNQEFSHLTGFATGEVNITVSNTTSINFTIANVTWGGGNIDQDKTFATLNTVGEIYGGNWTALNGGFLVENTGNVNVTFEIRSIKTVANFIGGTNPDYRFNFSERETGSCQDGLSNFSGWTHLNTTDQTICYNFTYIDTKDEVWIGINLTIPEDSNTGNLNDTVVATATDCSC